MSFWVFFFLHEAGYLKGICLKRSPNECDVTNLNLKKGIHGEVNFALLNYFMEAKTKNK